MSSADVSFQRVDGAVAMELVIDGRFIMHSTSQESIVRELQIHSARELRIDGKFFTELPTTLKTLTAAAEVPFDELMAALKLVAACASIDEVSRAIPERRAIPRAEKLQANLQLVH